MLALIALACLSVGMWAGIWLAQWEHSKGMDHQWSCPSVVCDFTVKASSDDLLERVKRSHLDAVHGMEGL